MVAFDSSTYGNYNYLKTFIELGRRCGLVARCRLDDFTYICDYYILNCRRVLFARLFSLTYPFWFAALLAWMLQPVARFFQHKLKFSRGFASLFGLLGGILAISALLTGIISLIYLSLSQFIEQVPSWIEEGAQKIQIFFNESICLIGNKCLACLMILERERTAL
ncbi:hypothetical protein [Bacillus sp. JCM 19041]|uniref:AI-2E family transporter n=1 Tax=Bacillus sp. JCM 19041 TaxID=1460637 RepID=UPI00336ABA2C